MSDAQAFQGPWNFLALPEEFSDRRHARAWILSVPYEATTSYGAGTRNGPAAIITASRQMELYDRELDCEPAKRLGIHTMPPMAPEYHSPEAMVEMIARTVTEILSGEPSPQILCVLGGEHSISSGVVRGLAEITGSEDLVAVQIDAHADLRDRYQGSNHSHGCAARRILDTCPLLQIGIRSMSWEEEQYRRSEPRVKTIFTEQLSAPSLLDDVARFVNGKRVFLTVDLDGLDPAIMPAVGTPEPGGLSWPRTLDVVRTVCREAAGIPVFDVVELAPVPGFTGPDFLAACLVYKTLALEASARGLL